MAWLDKCYEEIDGDKIATIQGFECIVIQIFNIAIRLAGIALFVMLIVGGFKYLTAGSDPKATESAQKTITSAVLGLVLILLGWFILRFIQEFTGAPVTEFEFPSAP